LLKFSISLVALVSIPAIAHPLCGFMQRRLAMDDRGVLAEVDQRPAATRSLRSSVLPIIVHFADDIDEGYAGQVLKETEESWQRLVRGFGFLPPHPDQGEGGGSEFDVYITRDLAAGVGGYAGFSGFYQMTDRADAFGYLVVGADLKEHVLRFVVSHELFHAIQMSYDWWEDIAFMEASANWATELVYDDLNVYWKFLPYFQAEPFLALDFVSIKNPYQYGMMLWPMFLDERLPGGRGHAHRLIWENSIQNDMRNEPDFLDAALPLARAAGIADLGDLLAEFSIWRLFVGRYQQWGRFAERRLWEDSVTPYFELDASIENLPIERSALHPLQPHSSAFFRLNRPRGEAVHFQMEFSSATDLIVQVLRPSSPGLEWISRLKINHGSSVSFDVAANGVSDELFVAISHFGEATYDPDESPWHNNAWRYVVTSQ
jgi:hypothetical protein